ncbi:hypothetical protein OAS88_00920 [Planktomarina temperata]|nr:hypothetical protein [Planktomarina temperata]MDC1094166.1 hypothetical protein [Planktomarina temperata]
MKIGLSFITVGSAVDFDLQKTLRSINLLPSLADANLCFEHLIVVPSEPVAVVNLARKLLRTDLLHKVKILKDEGKGIYQAMNIGLLSSEYQFKYFLNAGDELYNSKLWEQIFTVLGNTTYNKRSSSISFQTYQRYANDLFLRGNKLRQLTDKSLIAHQGIIFNRKCFRQNQFDVTSNCYWSDYIFIKNNVKDIYPISQVGAIFNLGGVSNSTDTKLSQRPKHKIIMHLIKIAISKFVSDGLYYRIIFFLKYKRVHARILKNSSLEE